MLGATAHACSMLAAVSEITGERLLVVRSGLGPLLVLSHNRQVDLAVLDLGLSRRSALALRRRHVRVMAWPSVVDRVGSALPGGHGPDLSLEPGP